MGSLPSTATERVTLVVAPPRSRDGHLRRTAEVRSPRLGTRELWYEVDDAHAESFTDRADPFVVATLIHAMEEGLDLVVEGAPVDAGLVRNLREFQRIWGAWYGFDAVEIHGDVQAGTGPSTAPPRSAVVAFSGGADSAFSAWWHTRGDAGNDPPLRTAMMIRGIDIPLDEPDGFARAAARARRMTDALGLELVTVTTNAWTFPVRTVAYTGMGVSAGLHVLAGAHSAGLVPSTATYRNLVVPLNSSPVSDWLLGSTPFAIVHDGARYNRLEKLRALAVWPEAMEALRVCLRDPRRDRNCGRCDKCGLTLAAFRLIGVDPTCFDEAPSDDDLRRWARTLPRGDYYMQEGSFLVDAADRQGVDEPWVRALRSRIRLAHLKNGVRRAFPGFADHVAAAHRRASAMARGRAPASPRR